MVRGLWNWLKEDISESIFGDDSTTTATESRTFGKIRRLQMALIPIIFKFGIISAMVAFLVLLAMKTIFLLKVLIFMNAALILGKFLTLKTDWGHNTYAAAPTWNYGYSHWEPHVSKSWTPTAAEVQHPSKEIHLHIHGAQAQAQQQAAAYATYGTQPSQGWERRSDPYGAYEPLPAESGVEHNELNNAGPPTLLSPNFPSNHRSY